MISQKFGIDVTFQTARPLSQRAGQLLWTLASHFRAVGPSTYRLETIVERSQQFTVADVAGGLVDEINNIVTSEQPDWPSRITALAIVEMEQVDSTRPEPK